MILNIQIIGLMILTIVLLNSRNERVEIESEYIENLNLAMNVVEEYIEELDKHIKLLQKYNSKLEEYSNKLEEYLNERD